MYAPVGVEVQDSVMRQNEGDIVGRKVIRATKLIKSEILLKRMEGVE